MVAVVPSEVMQGLEQQAQELVIDFVNIIGRLPSRSERIQATEAIIAGLVPHLRRMQKGNPEYNPNQPRDSGTGQWTNGGGGSSRDPDDPNQRLASGIYNSIRDSISKTKLNLSSKEALGKSLKDWWDRFTEFNTHETARTHHMRATVEAAGTVFMVLVVGGLIYALAAAYIPVAGQALGTAVGQALRTVLGGGR